MSGTNLEVHPDMSPEDVLAHYGVPGMQWGKRKQNRLERLERVQSGTASKMDKFKTRMNDTATGSTKSQVNAQIRAAKQLKSASESGEKVTAAALKYYGTRTVPQVAALTFNRAPKTSAPKETSKSDSGSFGAGRQKRLDRLERVSDGTGSFKDKLKTSYLDTALGSPRSQVNAQIRAARQLKTAKEAGSGTTKALLNYYGTRTVPQVAALTFNRAPKKKG